MITDAKVILGQDHRRKVILGQGHGLSGNIICQGLACNIRPWTVKDKKVKLGHGHRRKGIMLS